MENNIIMVNATDQDSALAAIGDIYDEAIIALANGNGYAVCQYGIPRYYTYKGEDDCDWEQVGEFTFTAEDIGITTTEILEILYNILNDLEKCQKDVIKTKHELFNIKTSLKEILNKFNK